MRAWKSSEGSLCMSFVEVHPCSVMARAIRIAGHAPSTNKHQQAPRSNPVATKHKTTAHPLLVVGGLAGRISMDFRLQFSTSLNNPETTGISCLFRSIYTSFSQWGYWNYVSMFWCVHWFVVSMCFNLFPHQKGLSISALAVSEFKVVGSAKTVCDARTCNRTEAI